MPDIGERPDEIVMSRANVALKRLAEATGGIYVPATLSQSDEKRILKFFEEISSGTASYETVVHHRIELFYYPLALALLILPFALYSPGGRGRGKVLLLLAGFAVAAPAPVKAGLLDFISIDRGMEAYRKGDYKKAADIFEKLAIGTDKAEAWLDLGNSYYRSGRYKRACWAYGNVITTDPYIEWEKLYNLANCHVRLGELERAAALYRKALEIHEDPDARYNLELVLRAMETQKRKKRQKRPSEGQKSDRRDRKGEGEGAPSKEKSGKPGSKANRMRNREISPAEEKKWMRLIEKQPLRAKLYPLTPPKEGKDVDPW
jgi:Ca-activated chloride channel family protein